MVKMEPRGYFLGRQFATYLTLILVLTGLSGAQLAAQSSPQKNDYAVFDCILEGKVPDVTASRQEMLTSIAVIYAKAGLKERALQLMGDARREASAQSGRPQPSLLPRAPDPDRLAIDMTLGYLEIGALDLATEFSHKITDVPFRARTLARIAEAAAILGDKDRAATLLTEALKTISGPDSDPWVPAEISHAFAVLGDCDRARETGFAIADKWPYIKAPELAKTASECAKRGSKTNAAQLISESLRVVGLMKEDTLMNRFEVQAMAASAQIDIGQAEKGVQLLDQALPGVRKVEFNVEALVKIADAYANAKRYEKAEEVADSIKYRPSQAEALLNISRRYTSSGDKTRALTLLDRSWKISFDDKNDTARLRYSRIAEIAVAYADAGRPDRANEVLIEALRELRTQEYEQIRLLLSIFSAYARSKLVPDETGRELIRKLCTGEAFNLTSDELVKKRRVEEAAGRFIERWHQTLDLNVLFDEMYVSNPQYRPMNALLFRDVYQFLSASAWSPGIDRDVDINLLREAFYAFWNVFYMVDEYGLAHRSGDNTEMLEPTEIKQTRERFLPRRRLPEKMMNRAAVVQLRDGYKALAAVYRKYLSADDFKTKTYLDNLVRQEQDRSTLEKQFRILPGFTRFGVPDSIEAYFLQKGVFEFYFIEEKGQLRVLTLGYEL